MSEGIERTQKENHNLLYSLYIRLNSFKNGKRRTPTLKDTEVNFKNDLSSYPVGFNLLTEKEKSNLATHTLDNVVKERTKSDNAMFLQGNCSGSGEQSREKAYSDNKSERQEFIDKNCSTCPVRLGCLNYAFEHPSESEGGAGVWGGTHPEERHGWIKLLRGGEINPLDSPWFPEYKEP